MTLKKTPPEVSLISAVSSIFSPLSFFNDHLPNHPQIFASGLFNFSAYVLHDPAMIKYVLQGNNNNYVKGEKYAVLRFLAGNGLITNDSNSWLAQRKLVQPFFHQKMVSQMFVDMLDETQLVLQKIPIDQPCDIQKLMADLTIRIVGRIMFGVDAVEMIPTIRREMDIYQQIGNILLRIPYPFTKRTIDHPLLFRMKKSIARIDKIIYQIIEKRRRSANSKTDLLDALIASTDSQNTVMTNQQLRDEVVTLFLAGHETTMLALSWTYYLILTNAGVQDRLQREIRAVFPQQTASFTYTGLSSLSYLDLVIKEGMRLYPPAYIITRQARADDQIGPYFVPAGKNILINVYGIHRHPAIWEAPGIFRPERFADLTLKGTNKYTYLPFGAGPRLCIGNYFSILEMKIILASLLHKFNGRILNKKVVRPLPRITLKPNQKIRTKLTAS